MNQLMNISNENANTNNEVWRYIYLASCKRYIGETDIIAAVPLLVIVTNNKKYSEMTDGILLT
jgi:hypothetical protein